MRKGWSLLAVAWFAGLASPGAWVASAAAPGVGEAPGISVTLAVSKPVYAAGEAVPIRLGVHNAGRTPVVLAFQLFQYVLSVETAAGPLWTLMRSAAAPQGAQLVTLGPGQTIVFEERWGQRTTQGRPVPSGQYRLTTAFGGRITPAPAVGAEIPTSAGIGASPPLPWAPPRGAAPVWFTIR